MRLISLKNKIKLSQKLEEETELFFSAPKDFLYAIFISARAKSEKQRGDKESDDADLTFAINNTKLSYFSKGHKIMYKDTPFAFSGGQLHNRKKTIVIFVYLQKGENKITLLPENEPQLEDIKIYQLENSEIKNKKVNLQIEEQAEQGDRRSFYTFLFLNQAVTSMTIETTLHKRFPDSDDLQIKINDQILKQIKTQIERVKWRFWFLAGHIFYLLELAKLIGQETVEKIKEKSYRLEKIVTLDLPKGRNIIEIIADESPILHSVRFKFADMGLLEPEKEQDPLKIGEGFNEQYVIKDSAFNNYKAISEQEIQKFLNSYHKVQDKPHISKMLFEGHKVAYWIKQASKEYKVNPKLLLTKLQAEQRLIKGEKAIDPNEYQLDGAMGVGMLDNGIIIEKFQGFITQINYAAKYFRNFYNEAPLVDFTHLDVDGQRLKVVNAATYSLYKHTPHFAASQLAYNVYKMFFGTEDLGGLLSKNENGNIKLILLIVISFAILLFISAYGLFFSQSKMMVVNLNDSEKAIYSRQFTVPLNKTSGLIAFLQVFSQKQATVEDGLYCGFRVGKVYQSKAKLLLYDNKQIVDSVDLTNPELILRDFSNEHLTYYKPWDIDGDEKKQEFIIQKYMGCNGNLFSFIRVNQALNKLEEIPIIHQSGVETFKVYVSHSNNDFKIKDKEIILRYYLIPQAEWFKDFYKYDPDIRKIVFLRRGFENAGR